MWWYGKERGVGCLLIVIPPAPKIFIESKSMLLINWYAVNSDRQPHQILTPRLVVRLCSRQGLSDTEVSPLAYTMLLQVLIHVFLLTTASTMIGPLSLIIA